MAAPNDERRGATDNSVDASAIPAIDVVAVDDDDAGGAPDAARANSDNNHSQAPHGGGAETHDRQ